MSPSYRSAGEISWLVFWPEGPRIGSPCWTDATPAAGQLIAACVRRLEDWGAVRQYAGGDLPVPGVYGVPEQWPHVRALYERAGFTHDGHTELVYAADVGDLRRAADPPLPGLTVRRSVGLNGTRLSALLGGEVVGYVEVEIFDDGERLLAYTYLEGRDETGQDHDEERAFLQASPFTELTRTADPGRRPVRCQPWARCAWWCRLQRECADLIRLRETGRQVCGNR